MKEGSKIKENEIVVILGRSQSFGLDLTNQDKLPFSYLSFFGNNFSDKRVTSNLKPHLRVNGNLQKGVDNPIYEINNSDTLKIYFIELFTHAKYRIETLTCILQTLINGKKYNPDVDSLYYFCHGSDFGKSGFNEGPIEDKEKKGIIQSISDLPISKKISSNNFFIATFYHEPSSRIFSAIKEKIEKQQLASLNINKIYKSFDKEKLADTKKQLINTFLPLAIDMQGLNQITDTKQKKKYLEEIIGSENIKEKETKIIGSIEKYSDDMFDNWKNIKEVLALNKKKDDDPKEVLSVKYQIENKDNLYFKPIGETEENPVETADYFKKKLIDLFKKDKWDDKEFIPTWLNDVVKTLDEAINRSGDA
jgi:hypothetical protein